MNEKEIGHSNAYVAYNYIQFYGLCGCIYGCVERGQGEEENELDLILIRLAISSGKNTAFPSVSIFEVSSMK